MLGFAGDPHALITTADAAARLGYSITPAGKPAKSWYNDASRRKAAGFPSPIRRGLYRLGDLQAWSAAGGFHPANRRADPGAVLPARPAALQAAGEPDPGPRSPALAPRAELVGRLHLLISNR